MRPVRLTLQAFGPYLEREVIDFREAVEAGLFGIYGQTGSGKSTIFSAMTFALFGEPAKTEQDAPSLRSDLADPGVQTEVEFVFDIGERRFVILRRPDQMRPKQRGEGETRTPHEAFLFDATGWALDDIKEGQRGKIVAEKKVRDVDAAVSEMLGYGPEQFRQIVLLPQGRFEAFLAAKHAQRIEILRDLFDVSLYRSLAAKLKADAEAAERHVREEREVCARRLAVEKFESTDALAAGIAEVEARHADLLENEKVARAAFAAAQTAMQEAKTIEEWFTAAEEAQKALAELQASKGEMDALADRVAGAECARSLLDMEAHVTGTADETREAEEKLRKTQEAASDADGKAKSAAEALEKETNRAGETEELRRQAETLQRHAQTLEKAAGITQAAEKAQEVECDAAGKLEDAQRQLTGLQNSRREKSEALKIARENEIRRHETSTHLATLRSALAAAETFETAERDVQSAETEVEALASADKTASRRAEKAQATFEEAERNLALVQALHLASKLLPGEPCPVCGAIDHPAPATGAVEHAGLDQAFREARTTWQEAVAAARQAEQKLTAARSVLKERQDRLAGLHPPEHTAADLRECAQVKAQTLDRLGPETDIVEAEAEIQRLTDELDTLEKERDRLRDALADLQRQTAVKKAQLDEMLSTVPEPLRDRDALVAATNSTSRALAERQEAKAAAE
ncbi:MAG: AAA family ATPase, partial [Pseudorhodoplanes sp.]